MTGASLKSGVLVVLRVIRSNHVCYEVWSIDDVIEELGRHHFVI